MSDEVLERVRRFVAGYRSTSLARVHPHTTLFGDLGVDGDDAHELLSDFAREFGVDLSELQMSRHFGPEGVPPWAPIYWIVLVFRRGSPEERARLEPITIVDLAMAAATGRWTYVG